MPIYYNFPSVEIIFEYLMKKPVNESIWWIKEMLINFPQHFNMQDMLKYFEGKITDTFYLNSFKSEFENYQTIIDLMKKISFNNIMNIILDKKVKEERLTKI